MQATDIRRPDHFHRVVDCQWACPAHTPVPEYIRLIAAGRYADAYMVNWHSECVPRHSRAHLRPSVRAGVPARPRRGEPGGAARAGRDLPPEARRRRLQGRHSRPHAAAAGAHERQARGLHRRRPGLADSGARPCPSRLRGHCLRPGPEGRRDDPHADPALPAARGSDRRGNRLRARPRGRVPGRRAHRFDEATAGRGLRRGVRRFGRAARPRPRRSRPPGGAMRRSMSASTGCRRCRSDTSPRSAGASSCSAAATPRWTAAAPHAPRRRRRQGHRPLRLRRNEGLAVGEGGRDARGHPDPQLPRAQGVPARQRPADRHELREGQGGVRRARPGVRWYRPASPSSNSTATKCWSRSARKTRSRGSSATAASSSTGPACRCSTRRRCSRRGRNVFFGGDAALGPKNIIWAVAQGHDAAISIDKLLNGEDVRERPAPGVTLVSQKMGIHEWSYDNEVAPDTRFKVPWRDVNAGAAQHQGRGRARLRRADRVEGSAALPELRRADRVHRPAVHRVRCLRRHLPDRLHHVSPPTVRKPELRQRLRRPAVQCRAAAVRLGGAEDRPRDGQGRGRLPALRACARSAARPAPGTCRSSC